MPTKPPMKDLVQNELEDLIAFTRNFGSPGLEAKIRAIAGMLDITLNDERIEVKRK